MKKINKKAFTLIELLVVVLIIGILAAIAVPQYQKAVAKSRFSQLLLASKAIWESQQREILSKGERTLDLSALDISIEGGSYGKNFTNNDKIDFDWGRCSISGDPGRIYIVCSLKDISLAYARTFANTEQWCCSTEKIGQELCHEAIPESSGWDTNSYCGTGGKVYYKN